MCVCGKYSSHNQKAYEYFSSLDLTKVVVYPVPSERAVEIYENFNDKIVVLHACPCESIEQIQAIQRLDPRSLIRVLHRKDNITLQASYEQWNYVLSCVAVGFK